MGLEPFTSSLVLDVQNGRVGLNLVDEEAVTGAYTYISAKAFDA
jgi:hypothetical protein